MTRARDSCSSHGHCPTSPSRNGNALENRTALDHPAEAQALVDGASRDEGMASRDEGREQAEARALVDADIEIETGSWLL